MYRLITIASLAVGAIMLALIAIAPQKFIKKSILEDKSKLKVVRIFCALIVVVSVVVIMIVLNNPYLFS